MNPNVIILISDALRPKDLSLYGRTKFDFDKNLRMLAEESTLFKLNFSASNGSDPSVTSLFSGRLTTSLGFIHQHPFMRDEEISKLKSNTFWLPIFLQKNGYQTISATPVHMWFKKGFDDCTDKETLKSGKFLDKPFVKRFLLSLPNWAYSLGKKIFKVRASPQFYSANDVMSLAMEKIKGTSKPFFLFMHLVDTHYPYPAVKIKDFSSEKSLNKILNNIPEQRQKEYIKKRFFDLKAKNLEQIELKRDESIAYVDAEIARLHSFLKKNNLWDNTLLFVLSDHGDNFGEHETYFCRGGLYDESVHVPLIAHIPGIKPSVVEELTQNVDIAATILDVIGQKNSKIDGKSLLPLMKTGKPTRNEVLFTDAFCEDRKAIRTKTRKFISAKNAPCFLCGAKHSASEKEEFDVLNDKPESTNIYNSGSKMEKLFIALSTRE